MDSIIERTLSKKDHCPSCGCPTVIITKYTDNEWGVECKQCHKGLDHTVSKRQAKIAWRLFAREDKACINKH